MDALGFHLGTVPGSPGGLQRVFKNFLLWTPGEVALL